MNNRGQSLVVFVLILPILVMFIALLINSGVSYYNKIKITGSIESNLEVILKEDIKDISKIKKVLEKNIKTDVEVKIVNDEIYIKVNTKNAYLFQKLMPSVSEMNYRYVGNYLEDTYYQE